MKINYRWKMYLQLIDWSYLFRQLLVRAPVKKTLMVHQVDMVVPVMRLMTVPAHTSLEVKSTTVLF